MRIGIIGAGYVGLVTGVSLASRGGHDVTLIERSPTRLSMLRDGVMPIHEPGLGEAFATSSAHIRVVDSIAAAGELELVFVAVATPISESGEPDVSQLNSAIADLRAMPDLHLSVRSTLPPGMSLRLPRLLDRSDGERLSTNPEFLRQGSAMADYAEPSRIVVGRYPETSTEHLALLERAFESIRAPRMIVSVAAAELIKNVANGFLALKLSFVNEVAALAEEFGVDVDEVLDGIALDPRIGSLYMRPGLGFGGSCLPKELQVLALAGRRSGIPMHIARAVAQVNVEQQDRFIRRIVRELPDRDGRVGLLGLSFKAHTDDLRGSPAVYVARRLVEAGHAVYAHDPAVAPDQAQAAVPGICTVPNAEDAFDDADVVVVATEWPQFASLDLHALRSRVARAVLFDGRNLIDPAEATRAGFTYHGVGRQSRLASA